MKVLSIKEPFASLIMNDIKHIETRSWKTTYRGEIYIHASLKKVVVKDERYKKLLSLLPKNYEFKYGKIICKCKLVDCVCMTEEYIHDIKKNKPVEYLCGHYEVGRYAWVLEDAFVVKEIDAKGKLGIWNY